MRDVGKPEPPSKGSNVKKKLPDRALTTKHRPQLLWFQTPSNMSRFQLKFYNYPRIFLFNCANKFSSLLYIKQQSSEPNVPNQNFWSKTLHARAKRFKTFI